MKIHLVQARPKVGDLEFNTSKILLECELASKENCDLICFPELFLIGYPIEDRILFQDFKTSVQKCIKKIVKKSLDFKLLQIALPCPVFEKGRLFNSILLIENGKVIAKIHKNSLPNYGVFDEKRYFSTGNSVKIREIKGKKVLFAICEDIWSEKYLKKALELKPNLVVAINASPFERGKFQKRVSKMAQFKCQAIYLNQVLGYDELLFDGGSFCLNSKGEITFLMPFFQEESKVFEITENPCKINTFNEMEITYNALVFGLQEYLRVNSISQVVLGLSGGIDSAFCTKIAIDAIGRENVFPVLLPSHISSMESKNDATTFLKINGLSAKEIPIKEIFDVAKQKIGNLHGLAVQNLQSRIRGLILMGISNQTGAMVLTTGNKSELAIGYCTIYGDMNGGFNPIKDVFKTDIFALCRFLNLKNDVFPLNMLVKSPTAELAEAQTDETSFGLPYKVLDFILQKIIEEKAKINDISREISTNGFLKTANDFRVENNFKSFTANEMTEYVMQMLKKAQFKREQAVCGSKISACSFGRDWRFGIKM